MSQPAVDTRTERSVYSPSRLNREARLLIERGFPVVWVEGELSNLSQPTSGHWYFSLKDADAQLRCAMFRQKNLHCGFAPKAGQRVLARGRLSLYEPRGEYQLIAEHLEPAGIGALKQEFERLCRRLEAEGLFDTALKRALPAVPRRIGVITSPTGAAIRDILHVLARRFPPAAVLLYPVPVQGVQAAPAIVRALELASRRAECDVLILARGGGSLEDLWAFNDERVARAIRASRLPVVAGIGHEVDFTIADFAADQRAPTPSGAAEIVVPDRATWLEALARLAQRLSSCMRRRLRDRSEAFDGVCARLRLAHPGVRIAHRMQRLDDLEQRLGGALRAGWQSERARLSELHARLLRHSPEGAVRACRERHARLNERLRHATDNNLARLEHRLALALRGLDAVSPLATLARGFAVLTRAADGALVTDAGAVATGEELEARLARGRLRARVVDRTLLAPDDDERS